MVMRFVYQEKSPIHVLEIVSFALFRTHDNSISLGIFCFAHQARIAVLHDAVTNFISKALMAPIFSRATGLNLLIPLSSWAAFIHMWFVFRTHHYTSFRKTHTLCQYGYRFSGRHANGHHRCGSSIYVSDGTR